MGAGCQPRLPCSEDVEYEKNAAGVGSCGTDPEQVGCYPLEKKDDQ